MAKSQKKQPVLVNRKVAAKALGITRQRLEALIRDGRIEELENGIDLVRARRMRKLTTDPVRQAAYHESHGQKRPYAVRGARKVTDPGTGKVLDLATARATKEAIAARRAQLDFDIKSGAYVPRDVVAAKEFEIARQIRDRILGLPAKMQTLVPPEAMKVVTDECEHLIREMEEQVARIAEQSSV